MINSSVSEIKTQYFTNKPQKFWKEEIMRLSERQKKMRKTIHI